MSRPLACAHGYMVTITKVSVWHLSCSACGYVWGKIMQCGVRCILFFYILWWLRTWVQSWGEKKKCCSIESRNWGTQIMAPWFHGDATMAGLLKLIFILTSLNSLSCCSGKEWYWHSRPWNCLTPLPPYFLFLFYSWQKHDRTLILEMAKRNGQHILPASTLWLEKISVLNVLPTCKLKPGISI